MASMTPPGMPSRGECAANLHDSLFGHGDRDRSLAIIADGLSAILRNAGAILEDAAVLEDGGRHERAGFLVSAACEEMGKAYVLIDACRLDFGKDRDDLMAVCRAFHCHALKQAYFDLNAKWHPRIHGMGEVKSLFRRRLGGPLDEAPDPGRRDMYLCQGASLFIDFEEIGERWSVPTFWAWTSVTEASQRPDEAEARRAFKALKESQAAGLLDKDSLGILNQRFAGHRIDERTGEEEVRSLYGTLAEEFSKRLALPLARFERLAIHRWPLYALIPG